jgi:hypothetical protein
MRHTVVYKRNQGQAMIVSVLFFMFLSLAITSGIVAPSIKEYKIAGEGLLSKQSIFLSESGAEDAYYRWRKPKTIDYTESITLNGNTVTTTTVNTSSVIKTVTASADVSGRQRKTEIVLSSDDGISFSYGMQIGDGGIDMQSTSQFQGNVFSNGPITGASTNVITGDAISAGSDGSLSNVGPTLTGRAHSITRSSIGTDAYYQSVDGSTTVHGSTCPNIYCHSGTADTSDAPLMISDTFISYWEGLANAGGSVTCSGGKYTISSNTTIGPKKIPCNLEISGSPTVTLGGPIWVTGNITLLTNATPTFTVSSGLGNDSVAVIADDSDDTTNSKITVNSAPSSAQFNGNGGSGSYVVFVSQNTTSNAVTINNSLNNALILYAKYGTMNFASAATIKEISGYRIVATGSASLRSFVPTDPNFTTNPYGSWRTVGWKETQ